MRIKIKNGSEPRRAPKQASRVRPPSEPASGRLLAALAMPRTPFDVAWTSEWAFALSPTGWYRRGFHA